MSGKFSMLLIAPPGRLRDSLRVLLNSCPQIDDIQQADTIYAGWQLVEENKPDIVMLDTQFQDEGVNSILTCIRRKYPNTRCCALIHSPAEANIVQSAGADASLLAGFSAANFFNVFEALISKVES